MERGAFVNRITALDGRRPTAVGHGGGAYFLLGKKLGVDTIHIANDQPDDTDLHSGRLDSSKIIGHPGATVYNLGGFSIVIPRDVGRTPLINGDETRYEEV